MTNSTVKIDIYRPEEEDYDKEKYFVATYWIKSATNLAEAAWALAIGQSVGNPSARSEFESTELFENHCCLILHEKKELENLKEGFISIAFPEANINFKTDGISHLLCQVFGGQCDIDIIESCILTDIQFTPFMEACLLGPKYGISGMKDYCDAHSRPLFGGITKPKSGLSPEAHLDLVKKLVDGGCDFIKEDEILSDPSYCPIEKRIPLVMNYIRNSGRNVFYCASINSDPAYILDRVRQVYELGGNGIHINFHTGMGVYKSVRELDLPILLHFQKSGDKILNEATHKYHIVDSLLYTLASKSGCDTLHCGMIGGYMNEDSNKVASVVEVLRSCNSVGALSCGMNAGLVDFIKKELGHNDWMANVGGALFSHPDGTLAGVKAMAQAVRGERNKPEFQAAIKKWGFRN